MAEGIDQLREEQRRIVGRIMRIIAIGTLLGGVFFLYTEFVMTMEQTRQWLLSDVPRDEKVGRALGEELPAGACEDLCAELDMVRVERDAAVAGCHEEHTVLAANAASSEDAFRASLKALENETVAQRGTIAQRERDIKELRARLEAANTRLQGLGVAEEPEPEEKGGTAATIMKRLGAGRTSKRRIKVSAGKAYFDDKTGLSVSLREIDGDYSAQVRIEAPGLGTVTDDMSPGEQQSFRYDGVRYTLVLLETDPKKGDAEFSLVGKAEE